jgi:hypothetical protein
MPLRATYQEDLTANNLWFHLLDPSLDLTSRDGAPVLLLHELDTLTNRHARVPKQPVYIFNSLSTEQ